MGRLIPTAWPRRLSRTLAITLILTTGPLVGCAGADTLTERVSAFASANAALSKIVSNDMTTYRSRLRANTLRRAVSNYVVAGGTETIAAILDRESDYPTKGGGTYLDALVCEPRGPFAVIAAQRAYLDAASGNLETLGGSPADDLGPLLGALFSDYAVNLDAPADAMKIKARAAQSCRDDLEVFPATAYGIAPGRPESGLVAAGIAVFEAVKRIVVPLAEAGLQEVDRARRARAIRTFLTEETNRKNLDAAINALDGFLKNRTRERRHESLHRTVRAVRDVVDAVKPLSGIDACGGFASAEPNAVELDEVVFDEAFQRCHDAIWGSIEKKLAVFLKAAAQYDTLADADAGTAVATVRNSIEKLTQSADEGWNADDLLAAAVRLIAVSKKLEDAVSEKNRKELSDAIDALVAAF